MNGDQLGDLLSGPVNVQVEVVRKTILGRCAFVLERRDDTVVLVFDLPLGPTADRYEIPFALEGWQEFRRQVMAFEGGIDVPRIELPKQ